MKLAVLKERRPYEKRVALTPDIVKKYKSMDLDVWIEQGAGEKASFLDSAYENVGAKIGKTPEETLKDAHVVLKVQRPLIKGEGELDELSLIPKKACLIGLLGNDPAALTAYETSKLLTFSLDLIPRITRAQTMDVLSSQSNLAGYRAVIEGVHVYGRVLPMMMTAAGTLFPAKVLILGAGVAGLQAIATARRLGAVVSAFDVREAAREQVESLGATFISVPALEESGEGSGGYAKEMSTAYQKAQSHAIHEALKKTNIAITTALIPGKKAPTLIDEAMVKDMMPGSVIVDMAIEMGGNCTLSSLGKVVEKHHVTILGIPNLPSQLPQDASQLYAKNVHAFLELLISRETHTFVDSLKDEILIKTCLTPSFYPSK
ncbi:MAG: NAD(P) transhydrogenase subunit alpha [Proteobacteria bacterium]|nr:NAD(P) transhydrogenase subunit alpha [Pseudomonadota bacterium]